ncbi:hypothetical protein C8J56DRAFT_1020066, partial [Mycena floridula]
MSRYYLDAAPVTATVDGASRVFPKVREEYPSLAPAPLPRKLGGSPELRESRTGTLKTRSRFQRIWRLSKDRPFQWQQLQNVQYRVTAARGSSEMNRTNQTSSDSGDNQIKTKQFPFLEHVMGAKSQTLAICKFFRTQNQKDYILKCSLQPLEVDPLILYKIGSIFFPEPASEHPERPDATASAIFPTNRPPSSELHDHVAETLEEFSELKLEVEGLR